MLYKDSITASLSIVEGSIQTQLKRYLGAIEAGLRRIKALFRHDSGVYNA